LKKTAKLANFANDKIKELYELFEHFTSVEWIFESKKIYEFMSQMSPEEVDLFLMDPTIIDWAKFLQYYAYGAQKYIFKQDAIIPFGDRELLLSKNYFTNFENIKYAFISKPLRISNDYHDIRSEVLSQAQLHEFIQN
jgi:Male sterility protein